MCWQTHCPDHPHHKQQSGCSIHKPFSGYAEDWMPNTDPFATRFNRHLPVYMSLVQDPEGLDVDALAISGERLDVYTYSTLILIPKSATAISTVPLLPPSHHSTRAKLTVVSRYYIWQIPTHFHHQIGTISKQHHPN